MPGERETGDWKVGPMTIGSAGLAYFAGIATHRATASAALPLETLQWILDRGLAAFLLVTCTAIAWAYMRERKERIQESRERVEAAERYADAKERSMRESERQMQAPLVPLFKKLVRVLAINSEVIRGNALTESEVRELESDTPEDGTPILPPRDKKPGGQP